jgi:adenylylsulfate kinase
MENKNNVYLQGYNVSVEDRIKKNKHKPFLLWFTGLSGSGKSTVANEVERILFEQGINTYTLDGDNIRLGLNKDLSFTEQDRVENLRRIAEVSKLMIDAGLVTLAAFVSPFIKERENIRNIVGESNFIEVFVDCPIEICENRDVKGLYKKARNGEIKNFTGIDSPYEKPTNPDIIINTGTESLDESANKILNFLKNKLNIIK